jgi:hypothetical protein
MGRDDLNLNKIDPNCSYAKQIRQIEKMVIEGAIQQYGHIGKAAEVLGVSLPFVYKRCKVLGIPVLTPHAPHKRKGNGQAGRKSKGATAESTRAAEGQVELVQGPAPEPAPGGPDPEPDGGLAVEQAEAPQDAKGVCE